MVIIRYDGQLDRQTSILVLCAANKQIQPRDYRCNIAYCYFWSNRSIVHCQISKQISTWKGREKGEKERETEGGREYK